MFTQLILIISFALFSTQQAADYTYQAQQYNLMSSLLTPYQSAIMPAEVVDGQYNIFLKQIVSIDEKNQVMTSSLNIYIQWTDVRLIWNPDNFDDIDQLLIPAKNLWLPDLTILNSADTNIFLNINTNVLALVKSDGWVNIVFSVSNVRTKCALNVHKFPFDKQVASIDFYYNHFQK
jgi:hypothetical protein